MSKYNDLINGILDSVGGKENIASCFHCATRLRLQLKDLGKFSAEKLDKVKGVVGKQITAEQLQIIIGPQVSEVYNDFCDFTGLAKNEAIDENLDAGGKLTFKKFINGFVDLISGSFVPLLPVIVASSFVKLCATILGPSMLNVISAESDLYTLFTFVGDCGFYFLPIYLGYSTAKKLNASVVIGMMLGAVLLHPTLNAIVAAGEPFKVFGLPMTLTSYASTTIPVVLIVFVMSYVEKFLRKIIPDSLKYIFVPFLTIIIMLPIALVVIGPLGVNLSNGFANILMAIANSGKIGSILVSTLGGGLWNILVLCGMHLAYYMAGVGLFIASGSDPVIMPTVIAGTMAIFGMTVGAVLHFRNDSENRSLVSGYLVTHVIGGITEPALFGIGMRYTWPFIGAIIGGACGALYYAITGVAVTTMAGASNFLIFTQFAGGSSANMINGVIGGFIAAGVAAAYTYLFGFKKEDQ